MAGLKICKTAKSYRPPDAYYSPVQLSLIFNLHPRLAH